MATVFIQKRKPKNKGKTTYQVQYKDPVTNKTCYYKTFQRSKDAQRASQNLRSLIDSGKLSEIKKLKRKLNPLKFREVAELVSADWKKRLRKKDLSKATVDDYMVRVGVLNRIFCETLLLDISKKALTEYQDKVFEEHSPVSANRYLFIIKQVFKRGVEVGAVIDDPSAKIKYLSEKQHERNKYLMPASLGRLVAASQKIRAKFYMPALIYLGAEHGASKQEALSLEWKDIDFDYEGIGFINMFRTKNSKERTEFLMPRTRKALLGWQAHLKFMRHRKKIKVRESRFVFCRLDGPLCQ